ncbi:energy-coupling factor transporter ATPase [Anaerovoracaceae bacterium 42-11]
MSIQVRNLSHIYSKGMPDEQKALDNINFNIYDGEIVGIIGHTGSGKSTLLQHLNGLLKADSGSIEIDGVDITKPGVSMRDIRKKVGLVFQYPEYQLFEETVALDVAFGPKNLGLSPEEVDSRVKEGLELVGLSYEDMKDRSPFELSGGQKRRVAIAGVIAMKPHVLILDEPTAGLDPGAHKDILSMIEEVHESQNNIILFVSHNMADVAALSDKVLVMDEGKLVMAGTPKEIFAQRDRLAAIGLSVPPVTELMYRLKERGIPAAENILDIKEAAEVLYEYLQRKS